MRYLSKFALTSGIVAVEDNLIDKDWGGLMYEAPGVRPGFGVYVGKGHVHATREAAVAKGEKMRAAKIASHEASIAALRALAI